MTKHDPVNQPTIPIAYLQLLIQIVEEHGVTQQQLLADTPFNETLLNKTDSRLSEHQWTLLVHNATKMTGCAGLGYEYGLKMRPTVHGVLGYAAMTCTTLREALALFTRYFRARQRGFSIHAQQEETGYVIELREQHDIPLMRAFFYENLLMGIVGAIAVLLGKAYTELTDLEIGFDWEEPDYFAKWRNRLPRVTFSSASNYIRLPLYYLSLRPVLADPLASRQAIELCERELKFAEISTRDISARVADELTLSGTAGYPNLEETARRLRLSERTLKRRLHEFGTAFSQLLEQARQRDAVILLANKALNIKTVSIRLGYNSPTNFSRAFRKWKGVTPNEYRATEHH